MSVDPPLWPFMPPKAKNNGGSGLGRAIQKHRAKAQAREYASLLHTTDLAGGMNSVTHENDLDDFLNSAQLADTDFTAERRNVTVISSAAPSHNPYLLTAEQESEVKRKQTENKRQLRVPRRPPWTKDMTKEELERSERDSFLEWRRGLAELSEGKNLLLTPFERNLLIWRQLWRTLERSHLIVQIVDARNPLGFRCEDLEIYVDEVRASPDDEGESGAGRRKNLLLINKADLLTRKQRYFRNHRIPFAFFSALDAAILQEEAEKADNVDTAIAAMRKAHMDESENGLDGDETNGDVHEESSDDEDIDGAARVLTVEELEALFVTEAPDPSDFLPDNADDTTLERNKLTIGLVGYPNVGKSSTINALVGAKKVSVSATPGKTKNFQTIHLSDEIVLCDCPGLVFPQFAATNADLVCDGVLPIDQMREHTGPVTLVTRRIPRQVLEATYGLRLNLVLLEEGGSGTPTASELLSAFAIARGFFTQGQGNPDESRASRYVLKDYVAGKLLYCHPPPGDNADDFNAEARDLDRLRMLDRVRAKRAPATRVTQAAHTFVPSAPLAATDAQRPTQSRRAEHLDDAFFAEEEARRDRMSVLGRAANAKANGHVERVSMANAVEVPLAGQSKKHFNGNKRQKQRSGAGYV